MIPTILLFLSYLTNAYAFVGGNAVLKSPAFQMKTALSMSTETEDPVVRSVTGEELEVMLTEWETPLVIDAYATWCGPCLLMAPEFEQAAKELEGKVRFVKLDTDKEPQMAGALNVMGLPTVLFISGKKESEDGDEGVGVLRDRIEGAIRKDSIVGICDYHFFDGPMPTQLS